MNILFLTTHADTGGITSYILTLGEALVKSGHKVLVASSGGDCVARMEAAGIKHIKVNIRTKSEVHPKLWLSFPTLKQLIKEEEINIIHAHTRVTQVLGFFLSRSNGVPMITTCHGFFRPRWFRKAFPCWGTAVIAISKPVARHLSEDFGIPQSQIHLVANGINLERFVMTNDFMRRQARQRLNMADEPLIGIIARLSDVKGIDVLIKAMPDILKAIPAAKLLIAGQGPEEAVLKQLTQDMSLTAHVQFKSTVNQTELILPAIDVFVMPSLMEGLGLSVMEAQACGIPVVASNVGGLVDLIEDGKTGFLVAVNNPQALAGRIIEMLRNFPKANSMAGLARSSIEKNFSIEGMLKQILQIYEQYPGR